MIGWILGTRFGRALAALAAAVVALVGAWVAGHRTGREAARADALRRTVTALQTRERIDDAIDQDPDLAARARSTGLLRDEPE